MKKIFFISLTFLLFKEISAQSNANKLTRLLKTDTYTDSIRKRIYTIISDEIVKALDTNITGDKNLEFLFTIKFRIDKLDSITYYASTLDGNKRNEDLFNALNIGLQRIKNEKLDYKVYEAEDIIVPIGIQYNAPNAISSKVNNNFSLAYLVRSESFIYSKVFRKYKPNQAIHKCYLWPMIYFLKPYSIPPDFM